MNIIFKVLGAICVGTILLNFLLSLRRPIIDLQDDCPLGKYAYRMHFKCTECYLTIIQSIVLFVSYFSRTKQKVLSSAG